MEPAQNHVYMNKPCLPEAVRSLLAGMLQPLSRVQPRLGKVLHGAVAFYSLLN